MFSRRLAEALAPLGWKSVACFAGEPSPEAERFLEVANLSLERAPTLYDQRWYISALAFCRLVLRYRPAVVHLHFAGYLSIYPWIAKLLGVPVVLFTDHKSRPVGFQLHRRPWKSRWKTRIVNYPLKKIIAVSDFVYRVHMASQSLEPGRFQRIYNGVDLELVRPGGGADFRRRFGIGADRILVTQVSWLIPQKGVAELLRCARMVVDANPKVHFAIVGEGSSGDLFRRQAEELGLAGHVTFTGQLLRPLEEGVYEASDIVCQASKWEEAFGWTIAEAMAFSKPLVATRVGAVPELVEDNVTGLLVDRDDMAGMAVRILRLAGDADLRAAMGAAGRRAVEQRFDLAENIRQHVALYTGGLNQSESTLGAAREMESVQH
jgi:glycosyltransferase involved in cell wall biosynthesis